VALNGERVAVVPWALVPAKRFGRAKTRLATALLPAARRDLARELCRRALSACSGSGALAGTLVATDGDDVCALAARQRVAVLRDRELGRPALAHVVDAALAELRARGATHALVIMADLPHIEARDVRELLALLRQGDVVIAPDALRRGTSALGLRIDLPFRSAFGHADSLQRHLREAERIGARARMLYNPRLAFDVDGPEDLARLAQSWASLRLPAARSLRARAVSAA
jgi:2-phospho-L-lactate guanylyltransferase